MMNVKARALGMTQSYFHNPNGLPDPIQHTTARDMAKLALALSRDFPQYYHYFSETRFTFHGRTVMTHNRFVLRYPGADGLKTGYIRLSGFNLASSAVRNGRRLVGVVMGGVSPSLRDAEMWALLDEGFGTSTPKSQNNALLLAAASGSALVPTLRPEDVSQAEDDTTADADADGDRGIGPRNLRRQGRWRRLPPRRHRKLPLLPRRRLLRRRRPRNPLPRLRPLRRLFRPRRSP